MAAITPPAQPQQDDLGQVLLFQAADGQVSLDVRLEADTVWLSQVQMGELFGRERSVITRHVGNVFREGELPEQSNVHVLHIAGADHAGCRALLRSEATAPRISGILGRLGSTKNPPTCGNPRHPECSDSSRSVDSALGELRQPRRRVSCG